MAEPVAELEEENSVNQSEMEGIVSMSRKEKRKAMKKMKRKQMRKVIAEKEREEEEARINDPEEQERVRLMEQEEAERAERERREFEERERAWMEAMENKKKREEEEEEEEERRRVLEDSQKQQVEKENELNEDDDWEYVEEGPAEIIWQGNEIIVKKKKVRVAKKDVGQQSRKEDADRPTSNPLPPQSEAFADYNNASLVSAHHAIENVSQQVPNFGTEQDKAHCPFHLKTGACRFGQRCSRAHFYPDKSSTLLIKNMYNGPGLAWEQDEGLELLLPEYTDEEVERCYEEFYEDVHTEFLKFGEIVNFKVCKNGSFHLRGNVYVHYESLDSAVLACHSINGRYFAGKQLLCEFVNVTRWKVAICGEYMKSRLKTCSHGTACNFIHCFRNPGGDYEWADWDKPPPKYWVKNMAALFGYSDESGYEKQMEQEHLGQLRKSRKMITADADRHRSRRSRSREMDCLNSGGSGRSHDDENDVRWRRRRDDRKRIKVLDEKVCEENRNFKDNDHSKSRNHDIDSDGDWSGSDTDRDRDRHHGRTRKSLKHQNRVSEIPSDYDSKKRTHEADTNGDWLDRDGDKDSKAHGYNRRSSRRQSKAEFLDDNEESKNRAHEADGDWSDRKGDRETHHGRTRKRSRHQSKVECVDDHRDSKSRSHDTDSAGESSHRVRDKDKNHSFTRERSGHHNMVLEFPDDQGDRKDRTEDADSGDDWSDSGRDRHCRHARKGSSHRDEGSEFSDDQGEPKKLKDFYTRQCGTEKSNLQIVSKHNQSGRGDRSSLGINEAGNLDENLKSNRNHETSSLGQYDGSRSKSRDRVSRRKSKEKNDEEDRWEPEGRSPGKHQISRRKSTHGENYEPGSPGHSDGRMKSSHDLHSEYYSDENLDGRWESERRVSGKRKSKRKVASDDWERYSGKSDFHDQNSGEHHDEKRLRGSNQ